MHSSVSFPLLTAMVLLPAVGALVVALMSARRPEWVKLTGLVFAVATGALTLWMLGAFDRGDTGYQFQSQHTWIKEWGIGWHVGVDGISLFLIVLTGVLFPI